MDIDISFRMKLWWLLTIMHLADFRQYVLQKPTLIEQIESPHPMRIGHDLHELVPDPFLAHGSNLLRLFSTCFPGGGFDLEVQGSCKSNCAQQTKMVLRKTLAGIADRPDEPTFKIQFTADKIDDLIRHRIIEHAVNGEITALSVFF